MRATRWRERGRAARRSFIVALLVLLSGGACIPYTVWRAPAPEPGPRLSLEARGAARFLREDGRDGPRFLAIDLRGLRRSRDGHHLCYPAKTARGWLLFRDGQPGPTYDAIEDVLLSEDGAHLAYVARRGGDALVVHDGREGPALAAILPGSLRFAAGGARLAYVGRRGEGAVAVVDGRPGPTYRVVTSLRFSTDGGRFAYLAERAARPGEPTAPGAAVVAVAVVDGQEGAAEEAIAELAVSEAATGPRVAYLARRQRRWGAVVDGVPGPDGDSAAGLSLRGGAVAYVLRAARRDRVVWAGRPGPTFEHIRDLTLSSDGHHLAYVGQAGGGVQVVYDGDPGPRYDEVSAPVLAAGRVAYAARRGHESRAVIDGQPGDAYHWVGAPTFSSDGVRHAYLARRRGVYLVVSGPPPCEAGPLEMVVEGTLRLSADGRRYGLVGGSLRARRLQVLVGPVAEAATSAAPRPVAEVAVRELLADLWSRAAPGDPLGIANAEASTLRAWVEAALQAFATVPVGDHLQLRSTESFRATP